MPQGGALANTGLPPTPNSMYIETRVVYTIKSSTAPEGSCKLFMGAKWTGWRAVKVCRRNALGRTMFRLIVCILLTVNPKRSDEPLTIEKFRRSNSACILNSKKIEISYCSFCLNDRKIFAVEYRGPIQVIQCSSVFIFYQAGHPHADNFKEDEWLSGSKKMCCLSSFHMLQLGHVFLWCDQH